MSAKDRFLQAMSELKNDRKALGATAFFKTAKGEYGEGDIFWGLTVPQQRTLSRQYYKLLSEDDLSDLLSSEIHEQRLCTLMMLVLRYQKAKSDAEKLSTVNIYRDKIDYVNNWDLVDSSAYLILGDWCMNHNYDELITLAQSEKLFRARIGIIATLAFIRSRNYTPTLEISTLLLHHKHDLIHKAVGWMLREVGNRDFATEYEYLRQHYKVMPRTMLRYAIEKYEETLRQKFLKGEVS